MEGQHYLPWKFMSFFCKQSEIILQSPKPELLSLLVMRSGGRNVHYKRPIRGSILEVVTAAQRCHSGGLKMAELFIGRALSNSNYGHSKQKAGQRAHALLALAAA